MPPASSKDQTGDDWMPPASMRRQFRAGLARLKTLEARRDAAREADEYLADLEAGQPSAAQRIAEFDRRKFTERDRRAHLAQTRAECARLRIRATRARARPRVSCVRTVARPREHRRAVTRSSAKSGDSGDDDPAPPSPVRLRPASARVFLCPRTVVA